jgi:transposase InsO family protein
MIRNEELETALKRHEMIAPLLVPGLDESEKRRIRREILEREGISERTLRRYVAAYRENNYEGLLKKKRQDTGQTKAISQEVLDRAAELRQELPERSVRRIIRILEGEGTVKKGDISRSTLSRHLLNMGFGATELKNTKITGNAVRRFQKSGRNMLWQSDIKYGPFIPTANGGKKRTYMVAFIDDATRLVCHAEFYDNQRLPILEDCFRKAILKYGKPDAVYVDNGKVYVSRWFRVACAKLGIRHINTKAYSPESKGYVKTSVM